MLAGTSVCFHCLCEKNNYRKQASAALLAEVSRTDAKLSILSTWTASTTEGVNCGHEGIAVVGRSPEARREQATLLRGKKVLKLIK